MDEFNAFEMYNSNLKPNYIISTQKKTKKQLINSTQTHAEVRQVTKILKPYSLEVILISFLGRL